MAGKSSFWKPQDLPILARQGRLSHPSFPRGINPWPGELALVQALSGMQVGPAVPLGPF